MKKHGLKNDDFLVGAECQFGLKSGSQGIRHGKRLDHAFRHEQKSAGQRKSQNRLPWDVTPKLPDTTNGFPYPAMTASGPSI